MTGQGYDEGYLQKTRTVECAPGFVPFTRASSAGLTGKRVIGCLRLEEPSFMAHLAGHPDKSSNAANPKGRVVGCPGGFREALTHFTCPLALRPVRNQGVVSMACRDLSRNHNAGCGPA